MGGWVGGQGDSLTSTRRRLQRLLDALQLPLLGLLLLPLLLGGIVAHGCRGDREPRVRERVGGAVVSHVTG